MKNDAESWYYIIQNNNPEDNSIFRETNPSGESLVYLLNPYETPPNHNPSQYDFEVNFQHIYNKKRNMLFTDCGSKPKFVRVPRWQKRPVSKRFSIFFNW